MARADRDTAGMLALRDVYERRRGGLLAVAADANVRFAPLPGATTRPLVAPRLNAVVMLTGNHSAGKSSLVNFLSRRNVQPTGDAVETTGFTVVAEKLNFFRYLSHFRSVHRGAYFAELRTTTVRKLLPESWGFMCPVHTPDGGLGLGLHLAWGPS